MAVPKIEVRDLAKTFPVRDGQLEVLRDLQMFAKPGEFVSIIGPSGCGKSTMFNIVAGLESTSAGEVLIDGAVATGDTSHVAYMPQKDLLFPWRRILDNTTLGLEIESETMLDVVRPFLRPDRWLLDLLLQREGGSPKKRAARAKAQPLFETFGLTGFEHSYPFELSGGMRQRAALLRTVVQERSVILLDEPFGALDALTRTEMQGWLEQVWEQYKWTVFLITHDIREAIFLADRVYVLTARPASVRLVMEIDIPRPRSLEVIATPEFLAMEAELIRELHEESAIARTSLREFS